MKKPQQLQRADKLWLSAVALLVLLQFWWLPGDRRTPDDTYSNSIEGQRGFFQTLETLATGKLLPPVRREAKKLVPDEVCTLIILSPDRYPNQHEQEELTHFVMQGGSLLFAPNWSDPGCTISALSIRTQGKRFTLEQSVTTAPSPATPAKPPAPAPALTPVTMPVESPSTVKDNAAQEILQDALTNKTSLQPSPDPTLSTPGNTEETQRSSEFGTESPLVSGSIPWRTRAEMDTAALNPRILVRSSVGTVQAASWQYGIGNVLLCASSDVFSNRAMLDASQAELAIRLVETASQWSSGSSPHPIVISEYLNVSNAWQGTAVLMSPALRSGTLQLMLVALLAGWFGFHRFGPERRTNIMQRRNLTESAAAVGNLHFRTNSGAEAVRNYIEYLQSQLQRMFGGSVRLENHRALATRTGLDADEIQRRVSTALGTVGSIKVSAAVAAKSIRDLSEILHRLGAKS